MKKERLTCSVTQDIRLGIEALGAKLRPYKNGGLKQAVQHLLRLAFADPNEQFPRFDGEETESVFLDADQDISVGLNGYQDSTLIRERRKAFKRALLQGYAMYLAAPPSQAAEATSPTSPKAPPPAEDGHAA